MPQISIRSADGANRRVPVRQRVRIGRARDSDIRLADRRLSRRHAEIHQRSDGCYLVDLGSTNGTFLNGVRVPHERPLRDGDVITVGEVTLVFHDGDRTTPVGRSTRAVPLRTLAVRNRVLEVLGRASAALLEHLPLAALFDRILDLLLQAIPADRAAVVLLEGDPPVPVVRASRGRGRTPPLAAVSLALAERAIRGRAALLVPDVLADHGLRRRPSIVASAARAAMCAPLWVAAPDGRPPQVLGIVYVDSRRADGPFGETDLELLGALANVAAAKIETARLYEEILAKRRLEQDLAIAAEIQGRVLPRTAPRLDGYDLAAQTRPSRAVGGDYYDLLADGGTLHLALGDVSGSGLGAALLMIALRAAVHAHWRAQPLSEAIARINAAFHEDLPDDRFATCFLGRLDAPTGRLAYVNAGQVRPLIARAGGALTVLEQSGTVLGAFPTSTYEEDAVALDPGDTLLVVSDGVSDAWPADGASRALAAIARRAGSAAAAVTQVLAAAERLRPRGGDDRTVLAVRRT